MQSFRKTYAEINLKAFKANVRLLKSMCASTKFFCPMVKANAYGHGATEITAALVEEGVKNIGVALIEEGVQLRLAGHKNPKILVFGGFDKVGMKSMLDYSLTPVLCFEEQVEWLLDVAKNLPINCQIKVNTGMNRLGIAAKNLESIVEKLSNKKNIKIEAICTHLANAEDYFSAEGLTRKQLKLFRESNKQLRFQEHALNSAAIFSVHLSKETEWASLGARPGISCYGIKPKLPLQTKEQISSYEKIKLLPVMSLHSEIIGVHQLKKGDRVSYGDQWVAKKDCTVGVVSCGYADGYQRKFSNCGITYVHNEEAPVVGIVTMDYILIDLTKVEKKVKIKRGDRVLLFGVLDKSYIDPEQAANSIGTISYELFTSVSSRVPRVYTNRQALEGRK